MLLVSRRYVMILTMWPWPWSWLSCAEINWWVLFKNGCMYIYFVANQGAKTLTKKLPAITGVSELWSFTEKLLEELQCCENLFTSNPLHGYCPKCNRRTSTSSRQSGMIQVSRWCLLASVQLSPWTDYRHVLFSCWFDTHISWHHQMVYCKFQPNPS